MPRLPRNRKIRYEGPESKNPLAFRHYNPDEMVEGKTMRTTCASPSSTGTRSAARAATRSARRRPCGPGRTAPTRVENGQKPRRRRLRVHGEARRRRSTASTTATSPPKGKTLAETNKNLDAVVKVLKEEQQRTGIKLLWGTANLFSNPRYMHGAATSPQRRRLRLRRGPGEEGAGSDQGTRRRRTTSSGAAAKATDLLQHRHEARARSPGQVLPHGRRLQEADRLQRPVLHRAQAEGADQAPVRLRRRRLPQLPARV